MRKKREKIQGAGIRKHTNDFTTIQNKRIYTNLEKRKAETSEQVRTDPVTIGLRNPSHSLDNREGRAATPRRTFMRCLAAITAQTSYLIDVALRVDVAISKTGRGVTLT